MSKQVSSAEMSAVAVFKRELENLQFLNCGDLPPEIDILSVQQFFEYQIKRYS